MPKRTIAEEAQTLVYGDRNKVYGSVLDDFGRTAALWNVIFADKLKQGAKFIPEDVASAQRMVKESRLVNTPNHRDSLIDIVGYALTQEKCWNERDDRARTNEAQLPT